MDYTLKVIEWLDKEEYSRNHWREVAVEMLLKADNDLEEAVILLAEALKSFHDKYRIAVIKPNNLLNEIVTHTFNEVDWQVVARSRYPKI